MKYIALAVAALGFLPGLAHAEKPSPLVALSDAEQSYYEKVFDYTMEAVEPGKTYDWKSYGAEGAISVGKFFTSKSKAKCRNFTETYVVSGQSGRGEGVACKRNSRDGWCKLKTTDAMTCAMEPPRNTIEEKLRDAGDAVESGKGVWGSIKGWFR